MIRRALVVVAGALLAACASHPLDPAWVDLSPEQRDARAVAALEELFAARDDGAGGRAADLEVASVDTRRIDWRSAEGEDCRLRWEDVDSVEHQVLTDLPARPESLYLYLRPDAPSCATIPALRRSLLEGVGITRPHLLLSQRPARSREALVAALDHLARRRAARPTSTASEPPPASAAVAPVTTSATPSTRLDEVEAALRRLRAWRDEGLITEEEYVTKRRALLEGL